jgi:hypothetical protein
VTTNIDFELWDRQLEVLHSEGTEILFGGASEGGKSHVGRILLIVLCLAIPGLQCVLIRKKFDDILKNHVEGTNGFKSLLAPLVTAGAVKITEAGVWFPRGSVISFQHCQDERQFTSAQGSEKHVIFIDEATQISQTLILYFRAWCRMSKEDKANLPEEWRDKLPLILYTANPVGPSTGFFRKEFVKARPPFSIENVYGFRRQYIPSRATDNLSVDLDAHRGRLAALGDEALAKALDEGDWDAPVGDFFRQYDEELHACPDFTPPHHWFKFRTFDWGGSDPFCVLWWAVSDGEEFMGDNGRQLWFPRGCLIAYREWYGCDPDKESKGLQMRNEDMARGIVIRTPEVTSGITLSDSLPFQDRGSSNGRGDKWTMADTFRDGGVPLTRANTDRVFGCAEVKQRLIGKDDYPLIRFAQQCKYTREYLPAVQQDPTKREAYVQDGDATHSSDCVRYACAARPLILSKPDNSQPVFRNGTLTPKEILNQLRKQQTHGRR